LLLLEEGCVRVPPAGCACGAPIGGFAWLSSTFTWSFIPPRQCNWLPQTKYLVPGSVKGTVVFPFVNVLATLVVLQLSKSSFFTSSRLWDDEYWNATTIDRKKKKNRERERSVLLPFNFFFLVIETLNYDHNVEVLT